MIGSLVLAIKRCTFDAQTVRSRELLVSFFGWTFIPFLLSSNLLVAAGTMKAERIVYLPSFGACVCVALILDRIRHKSMPKIVVVAAVSAMLAILLPITWKRNDDWSDSLKLWKAAREINERSAHTMYNYGLGNVLFSSFTCIHSNFFL